MQARHLDPRRPSARFLNGNIVSGLRIPQVPHFFSPRSRIAANSKMPVWRLEDLREVSVAGRRFRQPNCIAVRRRWQFAHLTSHSRSPPTPATTLCASRGSSPNATSRQARDDRTQEPRCRSRRSQRMDAHADIREEEVDSRRDTDWSVRPPAGCTSRGSVGSARGDTVRDTLDTGLVLTPWPCSRTRTRQSAWRDRSRSSVGSLKVRRMREPTTDLLRLGSVLPPPRGL